MPPLSAFHLALSACPGPEPLRACTLSPVIKTATDPFNPLDQLWIRCYVPISLMSSSRLREGK